MQVISLFSGCGGLDLGFTNAGYKLVYANDNDPDVWDTYERNHEVAIDKRSIINVNGKEIPEAEGILGGPPCKSWSIAGKGLGIKDARGKLFSEYIRILDVKKPLFFVAENVPGIISKTHLPEFTKFMEEFAKNYEVTCEPIDARNYGVPQARKRVIIVGYRKDLGKRFSFPPITHSKNENLPGIKNWVTLSESIGDLPEAIPAKPNNHPNDDLSIPNHEYLVQGFSYIYMSRNRKKEWGEPSFTIQASGRHAPLHPNSSRMIKIGKDRWGFSDNPAIFRRLSVRECARIQTFPDDFILIYNSVEKGYKMVGNAVPIKLAESIAKQIIVDLSFNK
jgi:DNA (cytosine-5)-methyltransferase 1